VTELQNLDGESLGPASEQGVPTSRIYTLLNVNP